MPEPLFDAYVMVDWSGGDRRRGGTNDCIWIAYGARTAAAPVTVSPSSRTEAEHALRALLRPFASTQARRVLLCADFAYGYPAGFASLLGAAAAPRRCPPWRRVWRYLERHVVDDIGTGRGRRSTNRSNRFEVASAINAAASAGRADGPFWCLFEPGSRPFIPQCQPPQPFRVRHATMNALRLTDRRAGASTVFRLFGTGSVGSQVLTGIPRLERLRSDPELCACSAVWPFETGWALQHDPWPSPRVRIVHAEIYPSLRAPLADTIKDRGQVRAMWHWARDLDVNGALAREFAIPASVARKSGDDLAIRTEEGWILGCPPAS